MCVSAFAQDTHDSSSVQANQKYHTKQNPIIPGYFADPTLRKFGDIYYLYSTTDGTGNGYGPAQVWVSYDCYNWKNIVMNWPTTEVVWAPDVVKQPDGKYRYYYCEPCNINVGESDSPIGPWKNILGKEDAVLVPDRYVHNVITLDPQVFTDDDGSQYLYFTTWGIYKGFGCGVTKLKDGNYDITELQKMRDARHWNENNPFPIAADKFFSEKKLIPNTELKDIFEAPFVFKRNGIYYFTYSSGSCHDETYRVQYATSTVGPMGPWEYKGTILATNEDKTIHGPGHHSVLISEDKQHYFIAFHSHNIPQSVHGFNRQVYCADLEFEENGDIKPVKSYVTNPELIKTSKEIDYALHSTVTASSYYDEWFKPENVTDGNNATLWKARHTSWDNIRGNNPEWIQIDLGKTKQFCEIWTQFEYTTFFYQYKIETSINGTDWTLYADRSDNTMQGSPMIDKGTTKARYVRLTILDTQKNGHMPAIWNIQVWKKAPRLPYEDVTEGNSSYPGMHKKDVSMEDRKNAHSAIFMIDAAISAAGKREAFDVTEVDNIEIKGHGKGVKWAANKPIRVRVKDGKWAFFFNGTQSLTSNILLPENYRYNAPYTITAWTLSTKVNPVATVASLSSSRHDFGTTEFRLGTDPATGLINHNGSFESCGAPDAIKQGEGKWQHWVVTFDGWKEYVYLNGELLREQNNFLTIFPEGRITIGADGSGTNNFMGYISSISIKPFSTSADAVKRIYDSEKDITYQSLGDEFEEIDPDSKFVLNPSFKLVHETKEITLEGNNPSFNDSPFSNGAKELTTIEGDFVILATIDDMEGLSSHSVKAYNEGGILVADGDTYYQFGAFPLYNCGNMFTVLSSFGRPQFPNYKGYEYNKFIQFERKGNKLYARSSADGKTWSNSPGSPVEIMNSSLKVGIYQTTYSDTKSWVRLKDIRIYK